MLAAQQAVDAAQRDIVKAQRVVDKDVTQNTTLRDAQKSACADPDGSSDGSSAGSPVSAGCTSAQADFEAYADTLSADVAALDKTVAAQDGNISALDAAVTALDALLNKLPAAVKSAGSATSGSTGTTSGGSNSGSHGSGGSATSGGSGTVSASKQTGSSTNSSQSTTETASAGQLAADQASIEAAEAQLELARQNLKASRLTSPIAGTVASVGFTVGSGSNGQSITILGTGNQIVKINVPLSQIDQVKRGQSASLAVDGRTGALHGTVTRIGLLSSTSGGSTRFPVAVTLADGAPKLYNGVGADVTITTGTASDVVIIPNSAITTVSTHHTVTVMQGGRTRITQVTLGLTGTDTSQVKAGLKAGAKVQLAIPDKDLPSSANNSTRTTRPFGGNFPVRFSGAGGAANFGGGGR